jgi:hypothetical protein
LNQGGNPWPQWLGHLLVRYGSDFESVVWEVVGWGGRVVVFYSICVMWSIAFIFKDMPVWWISTADVAICDNFERAPVFGP